MTQTITVTLETADFIMGRVIGLVETNKQLTEKINELEKSIDVQTDLIKRYERDKVLGDQINDLRSANWERAKK